jgi:hypothetical protein
MFVLITKKGAGNMFNNLQNEKIVEPPYEIGYYDKDKEMFMVLDEEVFNNFIFRYITLKNKESAIDKAIINNYNFDDITAMISEENFDSNLETELIEYLKTQEKISKNRSLKELKGTRLDEIFLNLEIVAASKQEDNNKIKKYNPFKIKDLFIKIAKIDEFNYKSIINFYNNYGVIHDSKSMRLSRIHGQDYHEFKDQYHYNLHKFNDLRICINLYYALSKNNIDYDLIKKTGLIISSLNIRPGKINKYSFPEIKKMNKQNNTKIAKKIIMRIINRNINEISFKLYLDENENLMPEQSTKSLFAIGHFQLYQKILNDSQIKKCKFCGSPFISETYNQKYCPAPKDDPSDKSVCKNRYDSMKNYWKTKIKNGEVTPEEAAKQINWSDPDNNKHQGRPSEEVKSWVE